MGMAAPTRWTAEMVRALPDDGKRYEVVDGELLVTPSPAGPHQYAVTCLILLLEPYVRGHRMGAVVPAPADIKLDDGSLVQPDVFVAELIDGKIPAQWGRDTAYLLFVEVISPSTARADRIVKRRRYQRAAIPQYWIVDLDARTVERWRPEDERPEILSDSISWQPASAQPPLVIDLPSFFGQVNGET